MPRFAANLSLMFTEVPFMERFARARACGFEGVEFLFPYDFPAADIAQQLKANNLTQVLFNMPPGNWAEGERGIAALPGREQEFRDNLEIAAQYAQALNCQRVHCMSGLIPQDLDRNTARALYCENLKLASERMAADGRNVLIEALNPRDAPGYLVGGQDYSLALVKELNLPNVKVQFDMYHCQIQHGDLIRWTETMMPYMDHIQIADVPERHEPGSGEVNYVNVLQRLDALGYTGWVGCEYNPEAGTEEGLAWMQAFNH